MALHGLSTRDFAFLLQFSISVIFIFLFFSSFFTIFSSSSTSYFLILLPLFTCASNFVCSTKGTFIRRVEGKSLGNGYRDGLKKPYITQVSMTLLKLSAYKNQLLNYELTLSVVGRWMSAPALRRRSKMCM